MTADHRCLTEKGWMTLGQATGLCISRRGKVNWEADAPAFAVNGALVAARTHRVVTKQPEFVRLVRTFSRVARIEYAGREMTYDLEVAGPYHNFVANGFIVHNSVNEESGRYSIMREEFHEPAWEDVGFQSKNNRQGRASEEVPREVIERFLAFLKQDRETAYAHYETFLQNNVARELARVVLPLSLYSQFYWEMNLHNLFHFLWLRMDDHAQKEIRDYANQVAACVRAVAPIAWEAFEEYKLYGRSFSRTELDLLKRLLRGEPLPPDAFDGSKSLLREFESKLGMKFNAPETPSLVNGSK